MMNHETPEPHWHILSDSELVGRARRLTVLGLIIGTAFVALLGSMLATSPVQEQGGPARAVRIPYSAAPGIKPIAPMQNPTTAALPPNPWTRPVNRIPRAASAPPVSDGKIYDM